jgi:maltase-glucoamylase
LCYIIHFVEIPIVYSFHIGNQRFPTDANLYNIDKQFLIGSNVLISPVLEENKTKLAAYMPSGLWYSYYDGQLFNKIGWTELDAPLDFIPIHIRGGSIIPTQEPANNTFFSRQKPFGLIVALNEDGEARGDLFYDDGESLDFKAGRYYFSTFVVRSKTLEMNIEHGEVPGDIAKLKVNKIRLFMDKIDFPVSFVLNGKALNESQVQAKSNNEIVLSELGLPMDKPFSLSWFDYDHAAAIDSNETLVDCSVENKSITDTDCKARSCSFNSQATNNVPKCTIPRGVGGYRLANNSSNGNDQSDLSSYSNPSFLLQKADGFSLYGKEIKNVLIKVTHGISSGNFGVTRVKVCYLVY